MAQLTDITRHPAAACGPTEGHRAGYVPVIDPRIKKLLQHWLTLTANGAVPERQRFNPIEVAPVLSYFWVLRHDRSSGCWRFTLAGENTLALLGRRLIGETIEEVFPDQVAQFAAAIDAVVSGPSVLHMAGPMYRTGRATVEAERLALPMRDGTAVDWIYGATVYHWPSAEAGGAACYSGDGEVSIVPMSRLGAAI